MLPWKPLIIRRPPPEGVMTIEEVRDRHNDKALRRLKRMGRCKGFPPPSKILHFAMYDANLKRLRTKYKGMKLRRSGHRKLKGWMQFLIDHDAYL